MKPARGAERRGGSHAAALLVWMLCAGAAPDEPGRKLLDEGLTHYMYGRYERSVETLRRASRVAKDPEVLARVHLYLGLNHIVQGQEDRAEAAFVEALTHDPRIRLDAYRFKPSIVNEFEQVRRGLRGTLVVRSDRPGAVVRIDGRIRGHGEVERELPVGVHRVEVRAVEEKRSKLREVAIAPERATRIEVHFGARRGGAGVSEGEVAGGEASGTEVAEGEVAGAEVADAGRSSPQGWWHDRTWTWVALGGMVASFAAAGGLWAAVQSDHDRYTDPETPDDTARALEDPIRRKVRATNAMLGLGATLAAAAAVLFFVERGSSNVETAERSRPRFRVSIGPGPTVRGSF